MHPREYGATGVQEVVNSLSEHGFAYEPRLTFDKSVMVFIRDSNRKKDKPSVAVVTCMKDEGPFVMEWVAYHKSIGVTDLVIFSNDCTDGTAELLDRLDELGIVQHFPNPSGVAGVESHQPYAIRYAQSLRTVRDAEWVISMDADEFINIHVGDGTLADLIKELPNADAISLTHLDFGSSGIEHFEEGFVTEQMKYCQDPLPRRKPRRGIKTLIRKETKIVVPSNHRPVFENPEENGLVWYNGAGKLIPLEIAIGKNKGIDCRGTYKLAQLNHYPVKSHDSFLTKVARGDAVDPRWARGLEYWKKRNINESFDETIVDKLPRAKKLFAHLMTDSKLQFLHKKCVDLHRREISELREQVSMDDLLRGMRG